MLICTTVIEMYIGNWNGPCDLVQEVEPPSSKRKSPGESPEHIVEQALRSLSKYSA